MNTILSGCSYCLGGVGLLPPKSYYSARGTIARVPVKVESARIRSSLEPHRKLHFGVFKGYYTFCIVNLIFCTLVLHFSLLVLFVCYV